MPQRRSGREAFFDRFSEPPYNGGVDLMAGMTSPILQGLCGLCTDLYLQDFTR
jgi:hypothetical protein